jgi:hypothetical protein
MGFGAFHWSLGWCFQQYPKLLESYPIASDPHQQMGSPGCCSTSASTSLQSNSISSQSNSTESSEVFFIIPMLLCISPEWFEGFYATSLPPDCQSVEFSRYARISSTRQTVVRVPSLTDVGNRPDLTPAHQVAGLTGINFKTCLIFKKPVSGRLWVAIVNAL